MARHNQAAIRHGVQKRFSPIEGGVQAHGIPEIARAVEREREKEADQNNAGRTDAAFSGIAQMRRAEYQRKEHCRGPETDPIGQRELRVAAKQKFLEKAHKREQQQIEQTPASSTRG